VLAYGRGLKRRTSLFVTRPLPHGDTRLISYAVIELSYFAISTPLVAPIASTKSVLGRHTLSTNTGLTKSLLDITIDGELSSSQTTNHEQTGRQTSERTAETQFASDLDQARNSALTRKTLGLVDLGEHGVGRLRDNGSSETSKKTRAKVYRGNSAGGQCGLVTHGSKDSFRELFECEEFGDGVGDPGF